MPRRENPQDVFALWERTVRSELTGFSAATSPSWLREPLTCPHLREPLTFTLWASCILPASPFASAAPQGKRSRTGRACPAPGMSSHLQDPKPRHAEAGTSKTSSFLTPAATIHLQKLGRRAQPQMSTSEVRSAPRSSRNRLPPDGPSLVLRSQHPGPPPASTSSQGRRPETATQRKGYLSRQEGRAPLNGPAGASALSRRLWSPSQTPGRKVNKQPRER